MGERTLVDYGIQVEESDYRAHVCFAVGVVYVFPTQSGKDCVLSGKYPSRTALQRGVKYATAEGYIVPIGDIKNCEAATIPEDVLGGLRPDRFESTTVKGERAIMAFQEMCARGLISLPLSTTDIKSKEAQIQGKDMIVTSDASIQVKCDYFGGSKKLGGTGNLFLQVRECNPLGLH